jgi:very-short-patch-repair endonuclease
MYGRLLERRVRDGVFEVRSSRVFVLAGTPDSWERDAWVGLLDAGEGAALSHDSALSLWRVPGFELKPLHVSRGRARSTSVVQGVTLHRPRLWVPAHCLLFNGTMPVVTPTRALFDVANEGEIDEHKLERAINSAWSRGLTSGQLLRRMADEWCERGRQGSAFFRSYLERRPIAWQPPESNLEGRFVQIIVDAGMPEPRRQVEVGDASSWIGRVDLLDPEFPLIAEIDSDLFHGAPLDVEADEIRDDRLGNAGFQVVRFTEHEVWHKRQTVVDRWRDKRNEARGRARRDRPA